MASSLKIAELQQAVESALKELQEAEGALAKADKEWKRVKNIPKGKAGGGKGAKNEASIMLREAKRFQLEKMDQLEVAQNLLVEGLAETSDILNNTSGLPESSGVLCQKRIRDEPLEESVTSTKKTRLSEANDSGDKGAKCDSQTGDAIDENPSTSKTSTGIPHTFGNIENSGDEELESDVDKNPSTSKTSTGVPPALGEIEKSGDEESDVDQLAETLGGNTLAIPPSDAKGGDRERLGGKTLPIPTMNTECGISDFSETETEGEDDADLPLYPSDTDEGGSGDEDRRAYIEKYTKNPELKQEEKKMYRFLSDTKKTDLVEKGRDAIEKFLTENKSIDPSIRRMARTDPTYLPEAASTSWRVAIHFLTSSDGNIQCGYHAFKNKSTFARDGWGKEGMQVRGVPGKKKMLDGKKKKNLDADKKTTGLRLRPAKELGNCGCRLEDIVLEFILSKRLKIRGRVEGSSVEEMMMGTQDYWEPRDRSFFFEAIRTLTPCFSIHDFFNHDNKEVEKVMKIAKKQAIYCLEILNNKYRIHGLDEFVFKQVVFISKERLHELQSKEKKLEELEGLGRIDT